MKRYIYPLLTTVLVAVFTFISLVLFNGKMGASFFGANTQAIVNKVPEDELLLTAHYDDWIQYHNNINFSYDFKAYDQERNPITNLEFLEVLALGKHFVIDNDDYQYQLYQLPDSSDPKIAKTIKFQVKSAKYKIAQQGKIFPNFKGNCITGEEWSTNLVKGDILVVKCWFVRCRSCIKEFPELNHIYDEYEVSDHIQFVSFAFDTEEDLKKLLSTKEFRYPVISVDRSFISKDLGVKEYPMHIIVGKDGKILKMINNVAVLEHFIEKYTSSDEGTKEDDEEESEEEDESDDDDFSEDE